MLTPEQIEERRGYLGGSDLAAALNIKGAFGGPWRVWAQKTGRDLPDTIDASVALVGHVMEHAIMQRAAEHLGGELRQAASVRHPTCYVGGHPDGLLHIDGRIEGIEAKTVQHGTLADHIEAYEVQCRVYMACLGTERWHLAALRPGWVSPQDAVRWADMTDAERITAMIGKEPERFVIHTFERDHQIESALLRAANSWWQRHIIDGIEPDPDASDECRQLLTSRHFAAGEQVIDAPDAAPLVSAYRDAAARERAAAEEKEEAANKLRSFIGNNKGIATPAGKVTWSRYERSTTDWESVQAEHPEIAPTVARFTRSTPTGRLNVSK